jgi:hypothetical protein
MINGYIFFKVNYNLLVTLVEQYHYYVERDYVQEKWKKFKYLVQYNEFKKVLNFSKFMNKFSYDEYQHKKEYSKSLEDIKNENHHLFMKDLNIIKNYKALVFDESSLKCTNEALNKVQYIVNFCKENNILFLIMNNEKFDSIKLKDVELNKYLSPFNYKHGYLGVYRLGYNEESDKRADVDIKRYLYDFKKQYNLTDTDLCYLSKNNIENYKKLDITL